MKCSRYIVAILAILSITVSNQKLQAQTSSPLIGVDTIYGVSNGDTVNLGETYTLVVRVKNYVQNSAFFGPVHILFQTDKGQQDGLNPLTIATENQMAFTPNGQTDSLAGTFTPEPAYFIFGGGITTVVVWPMVTAPIAEPYILSLYGRDLTGINEKGIDGPELSVFPNPANEQVAVVIKNQNTVVERVRIYSLNGQLLLDEQQLQNDRNYIVINTANLTAGMYVIEAVTKHGTARRKFVKM